MLLAEGAALDFRFLPKPGFPDHRTTVRGRAGIVASLCSHGGAMDRFAVPHVPVQLAVMGIGSSCGHRFLGARCATESPPIMLDILDHEDEGGIVLRRNEISSLGVEIPVLKGRAMVEAIALQDLAFCRRGNVLAVITDPERAGKQDCHHCTTVSVLAARVTPV